MVWDKEQEKKYKIEKISAGSYDLNTWLAGGYEKDVITMIAGSPGSGKTNFVMLAACSQARKGNKVVFIDTEGGFSSDRIKQLASENYEQILENIFILNPTNFEEQSGAFEKLLAMIKTEHVSLIIVDGMAMLYRLELGDAIKGQDSEKIKQVNREVAKQMRSLAEIARKQNIPVLITNQVYQEFVCSEDFEKGIRGEVNIVGGDLFKYWSKCIVQLDNNRGKRRAFLIKHRSLPEKEMKFIIKDRGVFKGGWI